MRGAAWSIAAWLPLALPGCYTARVHAGATVDDTGHVGFRGGMTIGLAAPRSDTTGIVVTEDISFATVPVDGDTEPALRVALQTDWVDMPDQRGRLGWRLGPRLAGGAAFRGGDDTSPGLFSLAGGVAAVAPVRTRRGGNCHEKIDLFCWRGTTWTSVGMEAEVGARWLDDDGPHVVGYLGAVLEVLALDD